MQQNRPIILDDRAAALARYPHARVVDDLVFVSGISSRRPDNTHEGVTIHADGRVEKDIRAQTRAVLGNIAAILADAGCALGDIVDMGVFLVDMQDYAGMNAVWNEHFPDPHHAPARTTVAVHQLPHPNLLVEMKAVARRPSAASTVRGRSAKRSIPGTAAPKAMVPRTTARPTAPETKAKPRRKTKTTTKTKATKRAAVRGRR